MLFENSKLRHALSKALFLLKVCDCVMFGKFHIARKFRYEEMKAREFAWFDLNLLRAVPEDHVTRVLDLLTRSRSQMRQDVVVLSHLNFKRSGFFIEFGATNGVDLNNTWLLEKEFGWNGIVAEPGRIWQDDLNRNRDCIIDDRCVAPRSGETVEFTLAPRSENSGISEFVPRRRRIRGTQYKVETVSFNDLLAQHDAPEIIDYASVDTEGSENAIMEAFDFSKHKFRFFSVEHNWEPRRAQMFNLMTSHGYERVHLELSRCDDWYVYPGL